MTDRSLPPPIGKQREVLYLPAKGHTVVLGTAGSGKTTLAILRALHLADPTTDHGGSTLLLTFNRCLVTYMRHLAPLLPAGLEVTNYHRFARGNGGHAVPHKRAREVGEAEASDVRYETAPQDAGVAGGARALPWHVPLRQGVGVRYRVSAVSLRVALATSCASGGKRTGGGNETGFATSLRRNHASQIDACIELHRAPHTAAAGRDGPVPRAMTPTIRELARRRRISRLCHFTPSRNLAHILASEEGILASIRLEADERDLFNPTDRDRLDGYRDHVCCSVQYPNGWYFRKAREREILFPDWVVLLLDPRYLWQPGTKFCPRNAAAAQGGLIREGPDAFEALFASVVEGARTYHRGPGHPSFLPTDEQAEVLIPDRVRLSDLKGVAVRDDSQARREASRLRHMDAPFPRFVVAPEFFDPSALSRQLRAGSVPRERVYDDRDTDG